MKTVGEVLRHARKLSVECTARTFWKYHKLGLLPKGYKISGRGNVIYFPDDTAVRLWLVQFLSKELEFNLTEISRYSWSQFESTQAVWRPTADWASGEFILEAKRHCARGKDALLRQLLDFLMNHLVPAKNDDLEQSYREKIPPTDI